MKKSLIFLFFLWSFKSIGAPYTYHSYDSMVVELQNLDLNYPSLIEIQTAQELFGLPPVLDGNQELFQYVVRIANETTGLDKPEILLVGTQHGDEVVGVETCLAIARFLVENYGQNPWLTFLIDHREIYIMPLANPWGFVHASRYGPGNEGSGAAEDMNRDHSYDRCSSFCDDTETLSTVGAQALYQLASRHLFRVVLDYHGGVEMILHPWGSPLHASPTDTSPDHTALSTLGQRFRSYGGPYSGYSPVGTASDLLGPVYGPLDDASYGTGWDNGNADPMYNSGFIRSLSYTIEISDAKRPSQSMLGGDSDLLTPGGQEDGYIPKNLRVGLAGIDIAEPAVLWIEPSSLPSFVHAGEPFLVRWQVRGCFQIDETRVRYGETSDLIANYIAETPLLQQTTGEPCFPDPTIFSTYMSIPTEGDFYLAAIAKVDQFLLNQQNPNPNFPPQSWLVRSRTENGILATNATDPHEVNTLQASLYRAATPVLIQVGPPAPTQTPTLTAIATATLTATLAFTATFTFSPSTPTQTLPPSPTPTPSNSPTPSITASVSPTYSPSSTPTPTTLGSTSVSSSTSIANIFVSILLFFLSLKSFGSHKNDRRTPYF